MKNLVCALCISIILASCGGDIEKHNAKGSAPTPPSLSKRIAPLYAGVWIKGDYLNKATETHSVLAAKGLVTGITAMRIDPTSLTGDSLIVDVLWDNHNGGTIPLKFSKGTYPLAVPFGEDELGYTITGSDTSLILYQVYQGKLYKTPYSKALAASQAEDVSYGLNYAINRALVAGSYLWTDGKGQKHAVTFDPNGEVSGLPGVKRYLIETDMKYGEMKNVDQLTFDIYTANEQDLTFEIGDDRLNLYDVTPDIKQKELLKGKLRYSLVRVK